MGKWISLIGGGGYGVLLGAWALVCAGFGEGTFIPMAIANSPALLPIVMTDSPSVAYAGMALSPVFWAVLARFAFSRGSQFKWRMSALMGIHYAGVFVLLNHFGTEPDRFQRVLSHYSGILVLGFALYLFGQFVLWCAAYTTWRKSVATNDPVETS